MSDELKIDSLAGAVSLDEAVELAYREELARIVNKLSLGLSVLIEAEKQLTLYLYKALRKRLKECNSGLSCNLISGHDSGAQMSTLMQRVIKQLQNAVFTSTGNEVLVLPHLDILATTSRTGLNAESRETAALLYENPQVVFLGFKDPSFELPKVIENAFPVSVSLLGLKRDSLKFLITAREARKFDAGTFNPYMLYKYLSGVNAVRCRQILSHFEERMDYDPLVPESKEELIREIRELTLVSDVELPKVDLSKDIGGYSKVKEKINKEILSLLVGKERKSPEEQKVIEQIIPKGIIFYGPPGTGKTYFAKAIATAINATVTVVSGPELKSKWVGESEHKLRQVFAKARKSAPSIIVFDELDSFASSRSLESSSVVEHSMVNQLLTEMDGFRSEEMVFVIGTTNFPEALDSALLRPGRFEMSIQIPYPDLADRKAILEIYRDKLDINISDEVLEDLAKQTAGFADEANMSRFTGDHLYAIMRSLKREELREGELTVDKKILDKVLKLNKPVAELTEEEEKIVAIHEAGHAILAYTLPHCPTIEKISIATGSEETLGYVMQSVKKNKYITVREELLDDICVLLGGRSAEKLKLNKISMGAYSDLQRANEIARMMVEEAGMGPDFTVRTFNDGMHSSLGNKERRRLSQEAASRIDREIDSILTEQTKRTEELLERYKAELNELSQILLKNKVADVKDLKKIFNDREFKING